MEREKMRKKGTKQLSISTSILTFEVCKASKTICPLLNTGDIK